MPDQSFDFSDSSRSRWTLWKPVAFAGVNLLLLALLIFVFPAFLAYLIAAFLFFNGCLLLLFANHLRRAEKELLRQPGPSHWQWDG